jgi:hypothetical protein
MFSHITRIIAYLILGYPDCAPIINILHRPSVSHRRATMATPFAVYDASTWQPWLCMAHSSSWRFVVDAAPPHNRQFVAFGGTIIGGMEILSRLLPVVFEGVFPAFGGGQFLLRTKHVLPSPGRTRMIEVRGKPYETLQLDDK